MTRKKNWMNYVKSDTKMKDKNIYDYDPYVLFDDWSSAVFDKLHHDICFATEDEHINIYGEKLMVVDGIVQECSAFDFFINFLERMGIYGEDGEEVYID